MPHTNRKKKSSSSTSTRTTKPTILHTKRQEILDDEGWIHVVDTPRKRSSTLTKTSNGGLHTGDFEIDGVGYVDRTAEEMGRECEFWRKGWEDGLSRKRLGALLRGELAVVDGGDVGDVGLEGGMAEGETESEPAVVGEDKIQESDSQTKVEEQINDKIGAEVTEVTGETVADVQTEESAPEQQTPTSPVKEEPLPPRQRVDNIVVLGLGSLQSARREGRRATLTQLAALQTIIQHFEAEIQSTQPLKVIFQEPLFTPLDKSYLLSINPHYEIVNDPEAFTRINEGSLVYAIHCYAQVYKAVSEGVRPAVLIGTDVGNFGRFNLSESADQIQKQLEAMVDGCEALDFPQVRHDFSDTKIYWRREASLPLPDSDSPSSKE